MRSTVAPSPLGDLVLVADGAHLVRLSFAEGHGREIPPPPPAVDGSADPVLAPVLVALDRYLSDGVPLPALPLRAAGTRFQERVWAAMAAVPHGQTATYGELARALGVHPRPLGAAVGANPLPVLLPCHRVLGAGGRMTGYVGGIERKRWLLAREDQPSQDAKRSTTASTNARVRAGRSLRSG